jgi:hypothetical protein
MNRSEPCPGAEGFKEPDDKEDDDYPVQDSFDLGVHGDETVDEVEDNADYDDQDDDG